MWVRRDSCSAGYFLFRSSVCIRGLRCHPACVLLLWWPSSALHTGRLWCKVTLSPQFYCSAACAKPGAWPLIWSAPASHPPPTPMLCLKYCLLQEGKSYWSGRYLPRPGGTCANIGQISGSTTGLNHTTCQGRISLLYVRDKSAVYCSPLPMRSNPGSVSGFMFPGFSACCCIIYLSCLCCGSNVTGSINHQTH